MEGKLVGMKINKESMDAERILCEKLRNSEKYWRVIQKKDNIAASNDEKRRRKLGRC